MSLRALLNTAHDWRAAGKRVAVGVVVKTWGSAPCPVGARLLVADDGAFAGSVSGGCIEAEVVTAALDSLADGKPQLLNFGVADETAWQAGLSCGGEIDVFVHTPADETLKQMRDNIAARKAMTLSTDLTSGAQTVTGGGGLSEARLDGKVFVEVVAPARRILIIGATHIAQEMLRLAEPLEMECVVIDPREAWANAARFPNADVRREWGEDVFAQTPPGKQDAVVALTHDPKIDDPALLAALQAEPGYIGALGSTRTHAKRLARLKEAGVDDASLAKIHAPVGMNIGARAPAEIALAIVAEIVGVFNGKL